MSQAPRTTARPARSAAAAVPDPKRHGVAGHAETLVEERRQLTVLFCDMVNSTELSTRVDPEVLRAIHLSYDRACKACIVRFGGHVHQFHGDGVKAFFGFPQAHENDAERAVRAGLDILEAMPSIDVAGEKGLNVRIGIATGTVVITKDRSEEQVYGDAMNLASRLQGIAEPGSVVVSDLAYKLAGGAFDYADLGGRTLKGFASPMQAYRVVGESSAASRFDAATGQRLTPLVGRERELGELLERWQRALEDKGQAVLLSGEPGIGKSRVLRVLRERLKAQNASELCFQCSPFHANSAFHPIRTQLERLLELNRDDSTELKLGKLKKFLEDHERPLGEMPYLAWMLSIPYEDRSRPPGISERLAKERTIKALVSLVQAAARARLGLVLFEDLHWADPTTLEVLDELIVRTRTLPLMVVLTCRPEFKSRWTEHAHVTKLELGRLTKAESGELVSGLTRSKTLPSGLVDQIIAKTDGIPLFIEELTNTIVESGTSVGVKIPGTVCDLLVARLDSISIDSANVKKVAQNGAAIGREFSYELIEAVTTELPRAQLKGALEQLISSDLVFRRETGTGTLYAFRHALVQDAARSMLLTSQRASLHRRIAEALEKLRPETQDVEPELLAYHYQEAGHNAKAVPLWQKAGEIAIQRFALPEALEHLDKGLVLLQTLPASDARDGMELSLRTVKGPAVMAHCGWAHAEVPGTLERAWELARTLPPQPNVQKWRSYVRILNALWVHYLCADKLEESLRWAKELSSANDDSGNDSLSIVGHRARSASFFWQGKFKQAKEEGVKVCDNYKPKLHREIVQLTNTDPLTGEGIYRSQYMWMLGYPDQAVAESDRKDAHARGLNYPFDLTFALTLGAQAFDFRCEPEELQKRTEEAEEVGEKHGATLPSEKLAPISRGIASLRSGKASDAVAQLEMAIASLEATGHRIWLWYLRALQAEGHALNGDLERALALIQQSVKGMESGEERSHYAEVLRIQGWVLMQQGNLEEAERSLRGAIDVARAQEARSWELRTATTLAGLLADRNRGGDRQSARELLAGVYCWFKEGFGTKDLKDAKTLLDQLEGDANSRQ